MYVCYKLSTNYQEERDAKEFYVTHRFLPDDAASENYTEKSDFAKKLNNLWNKNHWNDNLGLRKLQMLEDQADW